MMRLNAYLAKAGVASRRGADKLIKTGRVSVNGRPGKLNDDVGANDMVDVDDKQVKLRKSRYILLYKSAGYMTTLKDEMGRRKVTDLIDVPERVVPVGRLDKDTTGILLLTNDGDLAYRLTHPKYEVEKVYEAEVEGSVNDKILDKLSIGIELEEGRTAPAKARLIRSQGTTLRAKGRTLIELTVHEGRKHQVKRMLAAVGLTVKELHRSRYAFLDLGGLKPGQWRDLTKKEVQELQGLVYS